MREFVIVDSLKGKHQTGTACRRTRVRGGEKKTLMKRSEHGCVSSDTKDSGKRAASQTGWRGALGIRWLKSFRESVDAGGRLAEG